MKRANLIIMTALVVLASATTARAATYTVTSTADPGDGNCFTNGCTLREAIVEANTNAGVDFINFNIPGAGPHLILLTSALPAITDTLSMNGASQPGWAGPPHIEIGGDFAGAGVDGLRIVNNSSQIGWIAVTRCSDDGIEITGSGNATVVGCYLGQSPIAAGDFGNTGNGIDIVDSPNNDIGGSASTQRNVVSGNDGHGIRIAGAASTGNIVEGNYVGPDPSGTGFVVNDGHGILLDECAGNTVGGTAAGDGNVVSGNVQVGILLLDCTSGGNTVQGNLCGLNPAGTALLAGNRTGIEVLRSSNTLVGGTAAGAKNVVAGNTFYGIDVGTFSEGTVVQGNYVGTDITGNTALGGHAFGGISLFNVCDVEVGGTATAARNIVCGNDGNGIQIWGSSSSTCGLPNLIYGNRVGIGADNTTPLGNGGNGMSVERKTNQRIGGLGAGQSNWFANNTLAGVLVTNSAFGGGPATGVSITGNRIFDNGGLGIDLSLDSNAPDGVTPNDNLDLDTGANNLQNYPVINGAISDGATVTVSGSLSSTPSRTFLIEFFRNLECDPSGYGEGYLSIGSTLIATSAGGFVAFSTPITNSGYHWSITAAVTDLVTDDTSEFSNCVPVTAAACGTGNCYTENGSAGCDDSDCCNLVCDLDPFCCNTDWDALCVQSALTNCGTCGSPTAGPCQVANGSPGCNDDACCALVCAADPYCCNTMWDNLCADAAQASCTLTCTEDCAVPTNDTVDISDLLAVLAQWGVPGFCDTDGNGTVDVTDLLAVLAKWGACP